MRAHRIVIACTALLVAASAHSQTDVYRLNPGSFYEPGCHGACDCPVINLPLAGTFRLTRLQPDPLFEHFEVTDVRWSSARGAMTGSGTYARGGEVALQQEMVLDLAIAGVDKHLESGRVVVQPTWPRII